MTSVPQTVKFSANIERSDNRLILRYEVENHDQRDLYLVNRLYRPTPQWTMSPDLIYIHFLRDKQTVWLNKKIPDLPTDRNVLSPVSPFATPLRTGGRFKETVMIALPIREYREYSELPQQPASSGRPTTYRHVYFTLGFYWGAKGLVENDVEIEGHRLIVTKAPQGTILEFGELTSRVYDIAIPAVDPR